MGGGGEAPKPMKKPVRVQYKKEAPRTDAKRGKKKKPVGAQYLSSRTKTKKGGGFGGQAQTLG